MEKVLSEAAWVFSFFKQCSCEKLHQVLDLVLIQGYFFSQK